MSHFANGLVEFCPWMVPTAGPAQGPGLRTSTHRLVDTSPQMRLKPPLANRPPVPIGPKGARRTIPYTLGAIWKGGGVARSFPRRLTAIFLGCLSSLDLLTDKVKRMCPQSFIKHTAFVAAQNCPPPDSLPTRFARPWPQRSPRRPHGPTGVEPGDHRVLRAQGGVGVPQRAMGEFQSCFLIKSIPVAKYFTAILSFGFSSPPNLTEASKFIKPRRPAPEALHRRIAAPLV